MIVYALGACDPACPWCAREWFRWLKARMAQMASHRGRGGRVQAVSFAEAAATSIGARS